MLNCSHKLFGGRWQSRFIGSDTASKLALVLTLLFLFSVLTGCRRDMQDQPKAIAYRENSFYKDGTGSRPLLEGTVPRGFLREDRALFYGKKNTATTNAGTTTAPANPQTAAASTTSPATGSSASSLYPDDIDYFPFSITKADMDRGQERFNIYCSVCHGPTGYGDGMVARRGFNKPAPANYHQDRLRHAPVGHIFDVISNGWGAMPPYASQISVEDRWRIIAYVRALQLSQAPSAAIVAASKPNATPTPNAKEGAAKK